MCAWWPLICQQVCIHQTYSHSLSSRHTLTHQDIHEHIKTYMNTSRHTWTHQDIHEHIKTYMNTCSCLEWDDQQIFWKLNVNRQWSIKVIKHINEFLLPFNDNRNTMKKSSKQYLVFDWFAQKLLTVTVVCSQTAHSDCGLLTNCSQWLWFAHKCH